IATKADLSGYKSRIAFDGDFLEMVPSYTSIRDPLRRHCHRLNAYLFRHADGRKRGARMSSHHFVGCLDEHFELVAKKGLYGLAVVVGELRVIDMDKLVRLCIFDRQGDTWAWVAPGPKRQQVVVTEAAQADQEIPKEGVQADPTPVQASQAPTATPATRTMPQRMARLEDASGITYTSYGNYHIPYQRCTRRRTDGASTSAAPRTDDQPNP
nr:hypothetical protein [Tanacetum cinerariifolium]